MSQSNRLDDYNALEYLYCHQCGKIKEVGELKITDNSITCLKCGNTRFEKPNWIACPYNKLTAVKCPMGGKGIVTTDKGIECLDRCFFRARFD
ncbi:MAG: hypothetical protein ACQES4_07670 [Bacillota bacterium]